jgi:acyl-CoA-binding protein
MSFDDYSQALCQREELLEKLTDEVKLELYALYQQGKCGDI